MKARVLSVYDDGSLVGTQLIGAEGLSVLIETDGRRFLFDVGRRGNHLLHNLDHLEIPADSIDSVVLSHGHRGHTGALNVFIQEREAPLTVYAHKDIWMPRAGTVAGMRVKDIGSPQISEENRDKAAVRNIEGWTQLSEHLFAIGLPPSDPGPRFKKYADGKWIGDDMSDETALVLISRKGPVMICGCCHTGLLRAMAAVKERTGADVHTVIGGVHLTKVKNRILDQLAASLRDDVRTPVMYLCHCTSPNSMTRLRMTLGLNGVRDFYAGTEIRLDI